MCTRTPHQCSHEEAPAREDGPCNKDGKRLHMSYKFLPLSKLQNEKEGDTIVLTLPPSVDAYSIIFILQGTYLYITH